MLQTRAGRCPKCKETILPGVEICPVCGTKQSWASADTKYHHQDTSSKSTSGQGFSGQSTLPGKSVAFQSRDFVRWAAYFTVACLLVLLAMLLRSWVLSDAPTEGTVASHGLRVRDAEVFRQQVFVARSDPASPESRYVLGIAMPAGSDVMQITVRNEWLLLDYEMRLTYANGYANRWKKIHAPHRSYFSLLDLSGEEIGGRTWTGKVWVVEDHGVVQRRQPARKSGKEPPPLSE